MGQLEAVENLINYIEYQERVMKLELPEIKRAIRECGNRLEKEKSRQLEMSI